MILIDSLNDLKVNEIDYDDYYSKAENVSIRLYSNCMYIKILDNAMRTGKEVTEFKLTNPSKWEDNYRFYLYSYLKKNKLTLVKLVELLKDNKVENTDILEVTRTDLKGVRVFSPYYKPKAIKAPEKWKLSHVIKGILSGQITKGKCTMYLTDDYALDSANNFGKGEIDVLNLCKELIEEPSGWRVSRDNRKEKENGEIILGVNCYSFDYNELIFVEDPKEVAKKIEILDASNVIELSRYRALKN